LTTDQSNSEFCVPLPYTLGAVNSADSSEPHARGAREWGARRRLRNVPALRLRLPVRGAGESNTRRTNTRTGHLRSPTEYLLTSAHEDISRLNEILRSQGCTAVVRDNVGGGNLDSPSGAAAVSTPIFDADGCVFASLDIVQGDAAHSEAAAQLLRALVDSAACTITERWFRLVHRRQWVVAAMRRNTPSSTIIVATDRDQRIVGADRRARQLLEQRGLRMGPPLCISALFRTNPTLLRRRSYCDVSTTLFASDDGQPWIVLITPPDTGAVESHQDARVLLHVRPRLDSLNHLSSLPSAGRARRGLSQGALQRIEEYIEAHLDSALDIDALAAIAGMSTSHFTRSFHKSVGVTPHRYVIQNRVMRARELLATTNLPLTEIALTTGFSDQSHFSRRFHEIVGIPPGAFRAHDGRLPA
jgi:AraC-like DNA-binding protein